MRLAPSQCHAVVVDAAAGSFLPDRSCTPGAIDPAVTQGNIAATICAHGYTKTVRPPASNTNQFKKLGAAEYGVGYSPTTEFDHLVPLELGGTNAVSNLWPEPNSTGARGFNNPKDLVENALNAAVCSHQVTLVAAQAAIATNWVTAETTLVLK